MAGAKTEVNIEKQLRPLIKEIKARFFKKPLV
jgi:hypothetical protein